MKRNHLSVRLNGERVGTLEQTATGKMKFFYDAGVKHAISIGMPVRDEPYDEIHTEAYFGGLLPESETAKKIIGKRYGISHNNDFALLKAIGYDCAGAISCHEMGEDIDAQRNFPLTGRIISDGELYKHIIELPKKPLFMDVDGLRLSLAGVQDKAAVCLINKKIALAENGCPTTHILKSSSQHFEGMAENEYFCLRIAKKFGLPVPEIELRKINDIIFLLIERYDRRIKNDYVERIHQEDFCQALGMITARKYQNEGGPGFKDCFDLLKNTAQPAIDRNLLASGLVLNYLLGNMDAHAKNFSLLHHTQSNIRLTPFYDIICTRVYKNLSTKMAMKIGSKYESNDLFPRHWEKLCEEIQYRYPSMKILIKDYAKRILNIAADERKLLKAAGFDIKIIDKIIAVINDNSNHVLKLFNAL